MEGSNLFVRSALVNTAFTIECGESNRFLLPLHKHDQMSELLLITEGHGTFEIDGHTYEAGPETLLIYQSGIWHKEVSTRHPFKALHVGFRSLQLDSLPPDFFLAREAEPVLLLREHFHLIRELMQQIIAEFVRKVPESLLIANHLLGILFARLAQFVHHDAAPEVAVKPSKKAVDIAIRYMEENYRSDVSLETLAAVTYVNAYHLAHLFKNEVGISPIRYLMGYRMEVAKRYLQTTRLTMKEIGELVGYESETSFHNLFKRIAGMTPGQFRDKSGSP